MNPLRVYVETTVWSFAFAEDSPDLRAATLAFFARCRKGEVAAVVSGVVLEEVSRSPVPIKTRLDALLAEIRPSVVGPTPASSALADLFLRHGAVPPSKPEDAIHVASAFIAGLDVLVSWNFKHIASVRRSQRFNARATERAHQVAAHRDPNGGTGK